MLRSLFYFAFSIAVLGQSSVSASGQFELLMVRYENTDGQGSNGNCCDGKWGMCTSECDHYFKVCMDAGNGNDDFGQCSIAYFVTEKVSNQRSFDFGPTIGSTPNPITMAFIQWPLSGVKMKVAVWDFDSSSTDDHVDDFIYVSAVTPDRSQVTAHAHDFLLEDRTSLDVQLTVYCDADWYGQDCGTYCTPGSDILSGFYDCDPNTGDKICHNGWSGYQCTTNTDECASSPCLNDATCEDGIDSFSCLCTEEYTGRLCDVMTSNSSSSDSGASNCTLTSCSDHGVCVDSATDVLCQCDFGFTGDQCQSEIDHSNCRSDMPCSNHGTCITLETSPYNVVCQCDQPWTGSNCDVMIQTCDIIVCQNGGSCESTPSGLVCSCAEGFTGEACEDSINSTSCECENGGSCEADVTGTRCLCLAGWTGVKCDVAACTSAVCHDHGLCVERSGGIQCECDSGFTGAFCETTLSHHGTSGCAPNPCLHGGTCSSHARGFYCTCAPDHTGHMCEFYVVAPSTEDSTSYSFMFLGKLSEAETSQFRKDLIELLSKADDMKTSSFTMTDSVDVCQGTKSRELVSVFEFKILDENGQIISRPDITKAVNSLNASALHDVLPRELFNGTTCITSGPSPDSAQTRASKQTSSLWRINSPLVISLCVVGVCFIILVIGVTVHLRRKRQHWTVKCDDTSVANPLFTSQPSSDNAASSLEDQRQLQPLVVEGSVNK